MKWTTTTPVSQLLDVSIRRRRMSTSPYQLARGNRGILVLYIWIPVVCLLSIQAIFPLYNTLYFRELASVTLILISLLNLKKGRSYAVPLLFIYLIMTYTLLTVMRSDYYDLSTQIRLFARLMIFMLPALAVPALVKTYSDARNLFLFSIIVCCILALSAPLQELIGLIPWLYSVENWELDHGRAGFARYLSLFGDPNIGGMLGGLLPLVLLILENRKGTARAKGLIVGGLIWLVSLILVAYSLSFSGIMILSVSTLFVWLTSKGYRLQRFVQLVGVLFFLAFFASSLRERLIGVANSFLTPGQSHGSSVNTDVPYLLADVGYRLLGYLDTNNTFSSIIFGSTYNVVVPSSYFNPSAILAHNGYKEIYLAGGLVGLSLYLVLFAITALRAYRLLQSRHQLPHSVAGTTLAVVITYFLLVIFMWGFPIYHYNGIGIVFWISVGLVHFLYLEIPHTSGNVRSLQVSSASATKNR